LVGQVYNSCGPGGSQSLAPGDFYRAQFSDNQQLTLAAQGDEVAEIVAAVLAITGATKVTIVGHSMGGLAARAYAQYHAEPHLDRIVTVGTPHQGAWIATLCNVPGFCELAGILGDSVAVGELEP
jgi:triacylglycerol esterase/lipase EstA (alpha/beta hydrolase family)